MSPRIMWETKPSPDIVLFLGRLTLHESWRFLLWRDISNRVFSDSF